MFYITQIENKASQPITQHLVNHCKVTSIMRAEDLRIGNKVNLHGTIATVQANDFGEGNGIAVISGKPIPLTVDWFLLFGFETDEITYWLPDFQTIQIGHFGGGQGGHFIPLYKGALRAQFDNELMYVHELQNFYHGLGRELKQVEKKPTSFKAKDIAEAQQAYSNKKPSQTP